MIRAIAVVALGALLAVPLADRDDVAEPSRAQIEESVDSYSPEGSVELLVEETAEADGEMLTLGSDVLFAFGSSELDAGARVAVEALLADLPDAAVVTVDGHTDSRGGDAVNIPLSQARAQAVADLITSGRPDVTVVVTGHGSSVPLAAEYPGGVADFAAMATNRRVEVRVDDRG
jgi:outer membrane protein OmpA-like peptidoglycan-associated protein